MTRIALDFSTLDTADPAAGQYRYVVDLARGLAAQGGEFSFTVIGSRPEPVAELTDVFAGSARWSYRQWTRSAGRGAEYRNHVRLALQLRSLRADLLHALHGFVPLLAPCPVVPTAYDLMYELFPDYAAAVRSRPYRIQRWATRHRARRVIAISQTTADDLARLWRIPARRIDVVPLASRMAERAARAPAGRGAIPGVTPDTPVVASPYNLEPRKNLAALLEAMPAVLAAFPQARLVLHGRAAVTPGREAAFERHVAALGIGAALVRTGVLDDAGLSALYARADAYAFPSLYEGFGLPLLEAMAHGAAVVALRASAMTEVVGDAGVLLGAADAPGLAAAVVRLLRDPALRAALGARARARAAGFTVARMAEGTLAAYRAALRTSAP